MKQLLLIVKNVRRHPLRTLLTALGTMVLVSVVTLVWSVLAFLDAMSVQKASDFKAIVTEKWRIPSLMPMSYAASLSKGAARRPGDERPLDFMTLAVLHRHAGSKPADAGEHRLRHRHRPAKNPHHDGRTRRPPAGSGRFAGRRRRQTDFQPPGHHRRPGPAEVR